MRAKRAEKIWNWTVASKHVIIECEQSEAENLSNWTVASEAIFFCTFPPNSSKLRSDYLFSFQKRTNYLFPAFSRSEYLFPKSAPPPSESNGRPLSIGNLVGIKQGKLIIEKVDFYIILVDFGSFRSFIHIRLTKQRIRVSALLVKKLFIYLMQNLGLLTHLMPAGVHRKLEQPTKTPMARRD